MFGHERFHSSIENGTPARNLSTFSKSVSTCALEPGDEILEVDGIAARDNPGFSLEAIQGNQSRGYSYSNDTKFHIIFARPKRYSHQHTTSNPNIIHKVTFMSHSPVEPSKKAVSLTKKRKIFDEVIIRY